MPKIGVSNPENFGQTVLPNRSILKGQKIGGKCQNSIRHFEYFSNDVVGNLTFYKDLFFCIFFEKIVQATRVWINNSIKYSALA